MLFSNNKKLQRDRNVGLVFRWRGGYALNRGGSTLAFLLTSMVFAGGFIMLNVYAKPNTVPSRYRASMIQLGKMGDDLTWWVERNSPNLPEWEENGDEESERLVNALLLEDLKDANSGVYKYAEVKMQAIEIQQEGIYSLSSTVLPPVERLKIADDINEVTIPEENWKLKIKVNEPLAARFPAELEYDNWISEKWRGRSVRLILAVDARGNVLSVNPAEWNDSKTVREFENWVHTIKFKPSENEQNDTVTGVMDLSYSLESDHKDEEKEVQP